MSDKNITTFIDLLNHGDVEGDAVYRGSTDDALSDLGWQQMVASLENKNEWDIIITSPLQRCREFAELIAQEEEIDLEVNESFQEIDFGSWEGLTPEDIMQDDVTLIQDWWKSPTKVTPPEGEDFYDFQARVLKSLKAIVEKYQGQRILVVTHSGVIRLILMHILGMPKDSLFRINVDYANLSQIHAYHDGSAESWSLIKHG